MKKKRRGMRGCTINTILTRRGLREKRDAKRGLQFRKRGRGCRERMTRSVKEIPARQIGYNTVWWGGSEGGSDNAAGLFPPTVTCYGQNKTLKEP